MISSWCPEPATPKKPSKNLKNSKQKTKIANKRNAPPSLWCCLIISPDGAYHACVEYENLQHGIVFVLYADHSIPLPGYIWLYRFLKKYTFSICCPKCSGVSVPVPAPRVSNRVYLIRSWGFFRKLPVLVLPPSAGCLARPSKNGPGISNFPWIFAKNTPWRCL